MAAFIALLRAVNVGGTGKLPMTELVAMCEKAGFAQQCGRAGAQREFNGLKQHSIMCLRGAA